MYNRRRLSALLLALGVSTAGFLVGPGSGSAEAAVNCDALSTAVYTSTSPQRQTDLLTIWAGEHTKAQSSRGFTADAGILGYGSGRAGADLVPVARLYNAKTVDFAWAVGDKDVAQLKSRGFTVQHTSSFYAAGEPADCTVPVHRFVQGEHYAFAETAAERTKLAAAGWSDQGAIFHLKKVESKTPSGNGAASGNGNNAIKDGTSNGSSSNSGNSAGEEPKTPVAPAPPTNTTGTFSFAVIPDTQYEVNLRTDNRMDNRAQWLVNNKSKLGLEYVLHTGDVVNWGALEPAQFDIAKNSFAILQRAGIPYSLAIGNHDALAVGHDGVAGSRAYGGSAYSGNPECKERLGARCNTKLLIRDTTAFNKAFPLSSMKNLGGVFETGKVDNMWTTFNADGADWLVLTLEFHARAEAIAWAQKVVEAHPNHNVIVQTHSYLTAGGTLYQSNAGYGATTAQYLYDNLIKKYSNIKMVFSGHTGASTSRVDTGINGNTVVSYLGTFHSRTTNPVKIVTVDADTGVVKTRVEVPKSNITWTQYSTSHTIKVIKSAKK